MRKFIDNNIEYEIIDLTDRLCFMRPVDGWEHETKTYTLRKNMIEANIPMICQCGSTDSLDAHHIIPVAYLKTSSGNTYQDPAGNHHHTNGQWLCRMCHNTLHHNSL